MNSLGIISAILVNVALFTVYYVGLAQDQPVNAYAAAPDSRTASSPVVPAQLPSSPPAQENANVKRFTEKGDAGDQFKEVLDGKEVIEHKEVIDPKRVVPVGEFSDSVGVPLQPQLPNTEFRPPNRKRGISSAPNRANLQPPVISPESRQNF